jgi:putative phosphoesterase
MVMTLGLISDLHGDLRHTQLALSILRGQHVDAILCAGDLVEKEDDGEAVVSLIREQNIPCVMGNHDEVAPSNQRWLRDNADPDHPRTKIYMLSDASIAYLEALPKERRFEWEGKRLLLVHGTPRSNVDYLLVNNSNEKFRIIAQLADADVVIYGHTHRALQAHFEDVWFFNPGAVIDDHFATPTCATLRLPDCHFRVFSLHTGETVRVPYRHADDGRMGKVQRP